MSHEHCINTEQNKPTRIELLLAQRMYYARAKRYAGCFAFAAILLSVLAVLVGPAVEASRPYFAIASIVLLLLEVGHFLPQQRLNCRRGARIQEQFDTEVLKLGWNSLVAGRKVDAEDIREILPTSLTDEKKRVLKDWYEPAISRLPLHVGRLLCQRTNIVYDSRVRARYAETLRGIAIAVSLALIVFGTYRGLAFDQAILTLAVPVLPLLTYLLREWRKQADILEGMDALKAEAQKLWDDALDGAAASQLTTSARALQDAIYRHRATNPLVFDWYYNMLRDGTETLTRQAIESLVSDAEEKLNIKRMEAQ